MPSDPQLARVLRDSVAATTGAQALVGPGAVVLGILALLEISPLILTLVGLLAVGASQERFAQRSHRPAAAALAEGRLDDDLMTAYLPPQYEVAVSRDNTLRPDSSLEDYARLPAVFDEEHGTLDPAVYDLLELRLPPYLGGPFHLADSFGLRRPAQRLVPLRERHGLHFDPVKILTQRASTGGTFHPEREAVREELRAGLDAT